MKEYLVKGFAIADDRLKQAEKWEYFDECLDRIHDIHASENRFHQNIKDLHATVVDYEKLLNNLSFSSKKFKMRKN